MAHFRTITNAWFVMDAFKAWIVDYFELLLFDQDGGARMQQVDAPSLLIIQVFVIRELLSSIL